jgi:adenylyl-sulfate kinase
MKGLTVWFTGLPSSGKTTISEAVFEELQARHWKVGLIDGDAVRKTICRDLGFSKEDRDENVRRVAELAEILTRRGIHALVSLISPYRSTREEVYAKLGNVVEVFVHAPLGVCEQRDVKGLYRRTRARSNGVNTMTGLGDPYEAPIDPHVICFTDIESPAYSAAKVIAAIEHRLMAMIFRELGEEQHSSESARP